MPLALITGVHPETLSQEKFSHQNYSQFLTWNLVSQFHQLLVLQLLVYIHLNNKQWIFEQELCFKVANNAWMTEWLTTEGTMPTTGFFCWETSIFKHKGKVDIYVLTLMRKIHDRSSLFLYLPAIWCWCLSPWYPELSLPTLSGIYLSKPPSMDCFKLENHNFVPPLLSSHFTLIVLRPSLV